MNSLHWPRFRHVLANDFLQQWKKIWIATLALAGVGLVAYLTNVDPGAAARPEIHRGLFVPVLMLGGMIFTSAIFTDMHHPLQRFHYLTLPCSNLERFVSRYLLTGPLFCLYVLVVYMVFEWLASLIARAMLGTSGAGFSPFHEEVLETTLNYLWMHALVFAGAIHFRSHALIKTLLVFLVVGCGLVAVQLIALRVVFWDHFTSLVQVEPDFTLHLFFIPPPILTALVAALAAWVLFIAYLGLREHEVQGEL